MNEKKNKSKLSVKITRNYIKNTSSIRISFECKKIYINYYEITRKLMLFKVKWKLFSYFAKKNRLKYQMIKKKCSVHKIFMKKNYNFPMVAQIFIEFFQSFSLNKLTRGLSKSLCM